MGLTGETPVGDGVGGQLGIVAGRVEEGGIDRQRKAGPDECQALDQVRACRGQMQTDHGAHRVADDRGAFDAPTIEVGRNGFGTSRHGVEGITLAVAVAGKVDGGHVPAARREISRLVGPAGVVHSGAMDEDEFGRTIDAGATAGSGMENGHLATF